MAFQFAARIYPIIDVTAAAHRPTIELAMAVLSAGAPLIQLRAKALPTGLFLKLAMALRGLTVRFGAVLIINDRLDIAIAAEADGIHLGQDDLPPVEARRLLGAGKIIGFSTHSVEQVVAADRSGAVDYLGFGPIYETRSKGGADPVQGLDGLRLARAASRLPIAAIGGVTRACLDEVFAAGASSAAMIGEIAAATDPQALLSEMLRT